jgi:hypothetical protein
MRNQGAASRPPTAKGLADIGGGAYIGVDVCDIRNYGEAPTAVVEDAWILRLKEFKLKLPLLD